MTSPGRGSGRPFWALAACTLVLVSASCLFVGLRSGLDQDRGGPLANSDPGTSRATATPPGPAPATPAPTATSDVTAAPDPGQDAGSPDQPREARPASGDRVAAPPAPAPGSANRSASRSGSAPIELRIPAIDVAVPLDELGLNPDRTVEVPVDFQRAGWFGLGPTPGQRGSAVILGHVDSFRGPAVFYRIRTLDPGDRIEVDMADGRVEHFVVDTVEMYRKDQFPARQVYSSNGSVALRLVTCGGEFDTRSRSYLSNVVVYASLSGSLR